MSASLRILWLKTGPLHPLDTGGKIRTYHMLRELKHGNRITFLALWPGHASQASRSAASEYSHEQIWIPWAETPKDSPQFHLDLVKNLFSSRLPYVIEKYESALMASAIAELDLLRKHDLIVCDFLTPSVNLFQDDRRVCTPTLLFQHNVESRIWQRTFANARVLKRAYFWSQWRRMLEYEKTVCRRFGGVAGVSEEDCRVMAQEFGLRNVLGAVPTGVDLAYFCPPATQRKSHSLVFVGSMDWRPNIDGACYFVEEIFPAIKRKFPRALLSIVGRNPVPQVKELEARIAGVQVTGTVNDVRPHLAAAEVMVVPLRIGGGTRIKIYEAMATAIPVVSTTIGAEGLPVTSGGNILLGDSPGEFARCVCDLFDSQTQRLHIGGNGLALVQRLGSWASANRIFEQYCLSVCNQTKDAT